MNFEADCNCCPPATCDVCCMPQCSSKPYVRIRAERPTKYEAVCSTKNCNIFGGHDTNPMPEYHCHQNRNKIKDDNVNSLGSPIGLVASNVNCKNEIEPGDIICTRFSIYLKAFARLHLNDEKTWDSLLIDDIMKEGLKLYTSSLNRKSNVEPPPSDIYTVNEEDILREFELSGFTFHVELMPQFKLNASNSLEMGAKGDGVEFTLADFIPAVKSFFRQRKYALLALDSFYVMIWRSKDAYFVLDVCGRKVSDFKAVQDNSGVAMLMCFRSLQNIRHLMVNLSGLKKSQPLIIRELKVVKVITPNGGIMQQYYDTRRQQYEVVNDDYAYLRASLHLSLNRRDLPRNRSGLPVAVTAIIASKIDHPATWDMKMIDKIICFGVNNFCQSLWLKCTDPEVIDVNEFPTCITMGQFHVNIELESHKYAGIWHCVPDFRHSELAHSIEKAFDAQHGKLIVQINYQMYAIWKKHEFIYLLDPYRHRILGKQNESEVYKEMAKSATVRMFRSFEVFMNVFNHILLDSNRTSQFFIHTVRVKNIQTQTKVKPGKVRPIEEPKLDDYGEVLSINEHICFEEAEDMCKQALAEISDFEDEDLMSDVVEIELKTSSSEEEILDEEEAGWGELEEMEDFESSSSGEEGADSRKKARRAGKGRGKGSARKGAKKEGTKKSKKGKGTNDSEYDGGDGSKKSRKRKIMKSKQDKLKKYKTGDETASSDEEESSSKDKDTKGSSKATVKDLSIDKDQGLSESKDGGDLRRDKDFSKGKDSTKDAGLSRDTDPSKDTDLSKEKYASRDKGDTSRHKNLSRTVSEDKVSSKEKDLSKDKDLSKHKDLGKEDDIRKATILSKGKDNEDLSQTLHDESQGEESDSNKENEMDNETNGIIKGSKTDGKFKDRADESSENRRRHKDRAHKHADGTEADDENEECFKKKKLCSIPNPNRYPGLYKYPVILAVIGSETGSYESICKLFQAGFKVADRLLLMTPWDNFVIFRCAGNKDSQEKHYFLFDGCVCNFDCFRYWDLSVGTAGLLCFEHTHNVIEYIRHLRKSRRTYRKEFDYTAADICKEYCSKSVNLRL